IGVASMAESGVLTDEADTPLAPVIAWHDRRDEAELESLTDQLGTEFCSRTGLPLWTQWSLTKHRWLRSHHEPATRATRRYHVAEWVVRGWGGGRATELSLASRTGWLDLHTQSPWTATLDWAGAGPWALAELTPAGAPWGRAETSGALAGADGAVLTVAGHDHQVAAVGLGCHRPGDEFDSCGTAEAILRTAEPGLSAEVVHALARDGITVGAHAAAGRWCLLGATQGGRVLGTVMDRLGLGREQMGQLDELAAQAPDRPGAVVCGHDGSEVHIDPGASPGEVWRAAVRTVTGQAKELSDRISQVTQQPRSLVLAGGWTHSEALLRAKREQGPQLKVPQVGEAGCRGAAVFAGVAAGVYDDLDDAPPLMSTDLALPRTSGGDAHAARHHR
ncbi:MAG TPA: FGGY family carbohydrate kinase, partial [Ornithinimicrobium sp.]|uniref:FGGY-family carbohydrate kinase n=1 Tax=Ornithinimicrobium sp. TaxID=1977084 RepID=UPI002B4992E1